MALLGAGNCEQGVPAADDVFGGGPFAQADFVENFCADAVEGLLILVLQKKTPFKMTGNYQQSNWI